MAVALPGGFRCYVANIGIKDTTDDLTVIASDRPCASAGLYTQNSFAGPSVQVSREASSHARAAVIISKNANVAVGRRGLADAREVVATVAARLGVADDEVLIASTGVIGRPYPMDRVRAGLASIPDRLPSTLADDAARGIMTTDTVAKVAQATAGAARVVGIAKGVGMIEPDMATMIAVILTDAELPAADLASLARATVQRSFNCVSVDTDTSTSDSAMFFANGAAGVVDRTELAAAMEAVAISLARQIAADGEGAQTLIEVTVDGAASERVAHRVAKAIVNSPLVKTAVHGADPNWGRVAMAIGKATTADELDQEAVVIRFGRQEVYPRLVDDAGLAALSDYLRGDEVLIHVTLNTGDASATVWGCDLTDGYVRINADYTT